MENNINCTGNNGEGCFLESCGHNCGCEGIEEFLKDKFRRADSGRYANYLIWKNAVEKLKINEKI